MKHRGLTVFNTPQKAEKNYEPSNLGSELFLLLKIPLGVFDVVLTEALGLVLLGFLDELGGNSAP